MKLCLLCLLLMIGVCHASEKGADVKYVPPAGFAGHKWGDLRNSFERLPAEPVGVGAAWMQVQEKHAGYSCQLNTWLPKYITTWVEQCKPQETMRHPNFNYKGGGTYVLSEFSIKGQGFRFGDDTNGVVLHPVVYQFCANWQGRRRNKESPPNFDAINKFCGMKFQFQSETLVELSKLPVDHVSAFDRMLDGLIAKYGRPKGFARRGKVFIETVDEVSLSDMVNRKLITWRWCATSNDGMHPDCTASVTLTLDPLTGEGTVFYSTPILWEFAFAREKFGFEGDPLYTALHVRH